MRQNVKPMKWSDEPLYQKNSIAKEPENKPDKPVENPRPRLKWAHEILREKVNAPRVPESPLKIWWLEQQKLKKEEK